MQRHVHPKGCPCGVCNGDGITPVFSATSEDPPVRLCRCGHEESLHAAKHNDVGCLVTRCMCQKFELPSPTVDPCESCGHPKVLHVGRHGCIVAGCACPSFDPRAWVGNDVIFVVEIIVHNAEAEITWRPWRFEPFEVAEDAITAIKDLPNRQLLRVARYVRVGIEEAHSPDWAPGLEKHP